MMEAHRLRQLGVSLRMTGHAMDEQQRKALEEFKDALTTETERLRQKARALMRAKTDEEA